MKLPEVDMDFVCEQINCSAEKLKEEINVIKKYSQNSSSLNSSLQIVYVSLLSSFLRTSFQLEASRLSLSSSIKNLCASAFSARNDEAVSRFKMLFSNPKVSFKDVYLGGACSMDKTMLKNLTSMLDKPNLSYFIGSPQRHGGTIEFIDENVFNSSILFYFIPQTALNLDLQLEAAYYIGIGLPFVLCIELPQLNSSWSVQQRLNSHVFRPTKLIKTADHEIVKQPSRSFTEKFQSPFTGLFSSISSNPTTPLTSTGSQASSGIGVSPCLSNSSPYSCCSPDQVQLPTIVNTPSYYCHADDKPVKHSTSDEGISLDQETSSPKASPHRKIPRKERASPLSPKCEKIYEELEVPLLPGACEDFIRGRMYLKDLALNAPNCIVYNDPTVALNDCIELLLHSKDKSVFSTADKS